MDLDKNIKDLPDGEGSLAGLYKILEHDSAIRGMMLRSGSLLQWPNKAVTGCVNFTTLSCNYRVICKVLEHWCPKTPVPKTLIIEDVREQVGTGGKSIIDDKIERIKYNNS